MPPALLGQAAAPLDQQWLEAVRASKGATRQEKKPDLPEMQVPLTPVYSVVNHPPPWGL